MDMEFFDRAAEALPAEFFAAPVDIGVVLGSGWGAALKPERVLARVSYADIPGLGAAAVPGHAGELTLCEFGGRRVACFGGRRHWYEGVGWEAVCVAPEFLRRMGAGRMLLTNAVGGINPMLRPGDIVIITDHINTVGVNPLIGPHNPVWGERFPDMSEVYSRRLRRLLHEVAGGAGIDVSEGVYAFTSGPVFETPAEIRAYRSSGADVVGMSTVPEALFGRACGLEVAAISMVSNLAAGISRDPIRHVDVLQATQRAMEPMGALLNGFLERV